VEENERGTRPFRKKERVRRILCASVPLLLCTVLQSVYLKTTSLTNLYYKRYNMWTYTLRRKDGIL